MPDNIDWFELISYDPSFDPVEEQALIDELLLAEVEAEIYGEE